MSTRKIVFLSLMIAISIVLSIVESLISSLFFAFPGIKLGLANIATMVVIFTMGRKEGVLVAILRIFLVGLIFSGLFSISFWISLGGGAAALLVMILFKNSKVLSIYTISVFASLMHMVGQIVIVVLLLGTTSVFYYLPYMMIMSVPTGLVTGYLAKRLITDFSQKIMNY